jgi:hypothetical protein
MLCGRASEQQVPFGSLRSLGMTPAFLFLEEDAGIETIL